MKRRLLLAPVLTLLLPPATLAAPEFAPVLQSGMLLQRDAPVTIWGQAGRGETVTVSWKGQQKSARTQNGRWEVTFPPTAADASGSDITATDSTGSSSLRNVLVGDLWLASGQSNMEWNVRQSAPLPGNLNLHNPKVRLLRGFGLLHGLPGTYSRELYDKAAACQGYEWSWRECSPATMQDFSAVATSFALCLQESTGVPIGIICNAKGGSSMEAWIPQDIINKKKLYASLRGDKWLDSADFDAWSRGRAKQNLKLMLDEQEKNLRHPFAPSYQYEAAIAPIRRLNLRGVIWYQGESNADNPDIALNTAKQKDIITSWRKSFRNEALPFLMVQLPRINDSKRPHWPEFREAQARAARELAHVGLICTMDLGSTNSNVHPPQKHPVGQRLADLARRMVYAEKALPTYPRATGWKAAGNQLTITFDQELRTTDGAAPRGFSVGLPSKPESFTEVDATLQGNTITLTLPRPWKKGLSWRYLHSTFAEPNLAGQHGALPAFPARSDQPRSRK